jgi:hypothetical protein
MSEDDPYADLKQHRLTPENVAQLAVVPRKIQRRRQQFVMVPWTWAEKLATVRYIATYRVALHVLYRHWKGGIRRCTRRVWSSVTVAPPRWPHSDNSISNCRAR